jgi:hypothetical protein
MDTRFLSRLIQPVREAYLSVQSNGNHFKTPFQWLRLNSLN